MRKPQLCLLVLTSALSMASLGVSARAHDRDDRHAPQEHRYYDSINKDYHTWSGDEDRRYRTYLDEHHRKYRDFSKLNKKNQREYWHVLAPRLNNRRLSKWIQMRTTSSATARRA
jgi:hypothetical protein